MKILVIEDEAIIRSVIQSTLQDEFFTVDTARDGEEGAFAAKTNDYDLIILDNMLPKKDGVSVCREIRGCGKSTPILSLSVQGDTSTKVTLLDAGVDDYLTKPFCVDELLARVRALVRRPHRIHNDVYTIDTLSLDSQRHVVKRGKETIPLTRKEFMLLEYLMRNTDYVVTRGMMLEHVWERSIDPFSNTIEAHIVSLRKKIERPGRCKLIHTIPGQGYKLTQCL
ncbi:response regulator transcription factor [Candidatus Campbellbacteria bacterium]|nr:MAG: response regulator transcription factor [Candidatus Campbellbacteria bacterium]